jgi:hypothetical protein
MQYTRRSLLGVTIAAVLCNAATEQEPPQGKEAHSIPPRATPGDYQAHGQAGTVSIGAEFTGHSIPVPEAIYTTEDYVAIEVGLFGAPDARLKLSHDDFSLRVDGKKTVLTAVPYGALFRSLKDPEWVPPNAAGNKSKSSISTGDKSADGGPPPPAHMPIELERAMDQRVQKASLIEGERALPEAGLIFFEHRGKTEKIRSMELIYNGPAGKATLDLKP